MTMAIDNQQRFGLNFDHMSYNTSPQFTNPWSATSAPSQNHSLYAPSHNTQQQQQQQPPLNNLDHVKAQQLQQQQQQHQHHAQQHQQQQQQYQQQPPRIHTSVSTGSYANVPTTAASADLLSPHRSVSSISSGYGNESVYSSAPSPVHSYASSQASYDNIGYASAPIRSTYALQQQDNSRRLSQPSVPSNSFLDVQGEEQRLQRQSSHSDFNDRGLRNDTRAFGEAIDASRGMIAMSQDQTTPRNIYGTQVRVGRGSGDSYGFPSTHSSHSSISSTSAYPAYFGGSADSSTSDYSNAGSDIESVSSRTLPRPSGLINGSLPPAPASMMGQFSSKAASSTQKKHKCKVCDKRFTRPSSLQTHMYSHTGEKPFSCEVVGCGRNFSVVSNLRRHRKVHKGEAHSEAGSEDHQSDE